MKKPAVVGWMVVIALGAFLAGRYTGKPASQDSPKAKHFLLMAGTDGWIQSLQDNPANPAKYLDDKVKAAANTGAGRQDD